MLRNPTALFRRVHPLLDAVACNVYISAATERPGHVPLLLALLEKTQKHCRDLGQGEEVAGSAATTTTTTAATATATSTAAATVVHAFADPIYNRSSIHLAGNWESVAQVATRLACNAMTGLLQQQQQKQDQPEHAQNSRLHDADDVDTTVTSLAHPFVGIVDHISVMPLVSSSSKSPDMNDDDPEKIMMNSNNYDHSAGKAARLIGEALLNRFSVDDLLLKIYYYGMAHPNGKPLAEVRRDQTTFFRSGGLSVVDEKKKNEEDSAEKQQQVTIIGAPEHFVENYNIRLTKCCNQATARSLTRRLRERNGGLVGIEALTLPYSAGRWEVACNLLRPDLTTVDHVQREVDAWEREQQQQQQTSLFQIHSLVEKGYRVGTTAEQCLQALSCEHRQQFDQSVLDNFRNYLLNGC